MTRAGKDAGHVSDADPCGTCPWRLGNHGRRHPDGWFTKANRDRLWSQLRRGEMMSCHPTDPANPVSEKAQEAGYRPAPEGATRLECRGAVIIQQRELHLLINRYDMSVADYRRDRPRGLTRDGISAMVARLAFGGTFLGGPKVARPDLNAAVGHDPLPWDESCIKDIMHQTEDKVS
jgi:hypothetical protein